MILAVSSAFEGFPVSDLSGWRGKRVEHRKMASARRHLVAARRQEQSGFALIEVVVAITILTLVFFAVEWASAETTTASVTATQQATESSLAMQAIAQAEALPFLDLQAGSSATDLAAALNGLHRRCSTGPRCRSVRGSTA